MQISKVLIEGSDLASLIDLYQKNLDDYNKVLVKSGKTYILIYEGYFALNIQEKLVVTMIFDFNIDGKCDVDIIVGGELDVLINALWDPEKSKDIKIMKALKDICDSKKWILTQVNVK